MFYDIALLSTAACCVRVRERRRSCASVTWLDIVESGVTDKLTKDRDAVERYREERGRTTEEGMRLWRQTLSGGESAESTGCTAVNESKSISCCPLVLLHL